jgi:hypothetical protein
MAKKKRNKKDYCEKCNTYTWLDQHHILPQSTFGENEETIMLCPNCHREYHKYLGDENLKNPSMKFHLYTFYKWRHGLSIALFIVVGIAYYFINY